MARKQDSDHELVASGAGSAPARRRLSKHSRSAARANVAPPAESTPEATEQKPVHTPSREEIARVAYSYWEARGCQGGRPEDDWLRAEEELSAAR